MENYKIKQRLRLKNKCLPKWVLCYVPILLCIPIRFETFEFHCGTTSLQCLSQCLWAPFAYWFMYGKYVQNLVFSHKYKEQKFSKQKILLFKQNILHFRLLHFIDGCFCTAVELGLDDL